MEKGKKIITEESYINEVECRYDEETDWNESFEERDTGINESSESDVTSYRRPPRVDSQSDASLMFDSNLLERFVTCAKSNASLLQKNEILTSKLLKNRLSRIQLKDENAKLKQKISLSCRDNEGALKMEKEVEELSKVKEKLLATLDDVKRKTEKTLHKTNTAFKMHEEKNALTKRSLNEVKKQKKSADKKCFEMCKKVKNKSNEVKELTIKMENVMKRKELNNNKKIINFENARNSLELEKIHAFLLHTENLQEIDRRQKEIERQRQDFQQNEKIKFQKSLQKVKERRVKELRTIIDELSKIKGKAFVSKILNNYANTRSLIDVICSNENSNGLEVNVMNNKEGIQCFEVQESFKKKFDHGDDIIFAAIVREMEQLQIIFVDTDKVLIKNENEIKTSKKAIEKLQKQILGENNLMLIVTKLKKELEYVKNDVSMMKHLEKQRSIEHENDELVNLCLVVNSRLLAAEHKSIHQKLEEDLMIMYNHYSSERRERSNLMIEEIKEIITMKEHLNSLC